MIKSVGIVAAGLVAWIVVTPVINKGLQVLGDYQRQVTTGEVADITNVRIENRDGITGVPLEPDQTFYIAFHLKRNLTCESTTQNKVVDARDTELTVWNVEATPLAYVKRGEIETREMLHLPSWFPPGNYKFQRIVKYTCNRYSEPAFLVFPAVPFEVQAHEH